MYMILFIYPPRDSGLRPSLRLGCFFTKFGIEMGGFSSLREVPK